MPVQRASLDYKNLSDRFAKTNKNYSNQYCKIYLVRLQKMKELLEDTIKNKWKGQYETCRLHKLSEEQNKEAKYIVVGTLFKDQKLKPSVLKRLAESNQLIPQPIPLHFTDETDVLFVEDDLQRYQLVGDLSKEKLVTGITCALLVMDIGKGKLMVHDYCFADYRRQIERPIFNEDLYIVFISGLDLVHFEKSLLALQLFTNFVSGVLGDLDDVKVSNITRIIVAGNCIRTVKEASKPSLSLTSRTTISTDTIEAVKVMDTIFDNWCQLIDVDVMPGENDPSNHIMPQQSMHRCMFPDSGLYKSLHLVSNPYDFEVGKLSLIGTCGQPVTDVLRFSDITDPLDVMESCLKWGHLAPTAPDTLGCYPFYEKDPFIIENCPHVMFAGNQESFSTKLCEGDNGQVVRLITIPEFAETHTACILNLKNLDCKPITFKI